MCIHIFVELQLKVAVEKICNIFNGFTFMLPKFTFLQPTLRKTSLSR